MTLPLAKFFSTKDPKANQCSDGDTIYHWGNYVNNQR